MLYVEWSRAEELPFCCCSRFNLFWPSKRFLLGIFHLFSSQRNHRKPPTMYGHMKKNTIFFLPLNLVDIGFKISNRDIRYCIVWNIQRHSQHKRIKRQCSAMRMERSWSFDYIFFPRWLLSVQNEIRRKKKNKNTTIEHSKTIAGVNSLTLNLCVIPEINTTNGESNAIPICFSFTICTQMKRKHMKRFDFGKYR